MPTQRSSNSWERWRGGVDQQLIEITATLERIEASLASLPALKTKIAIASAAAGVLIAAIANAAVRKLFG